MHKSGLWPRIVHLVFVVVCVLVLPTLVGVTLDSRLGIWPWGLLAALIVGLPVATFFIVRYTLDGYRRLEKAHTSAASHYTTSTLSTNSTIKEDEHT